MRIIKSILIVSFLPIFLFGQTEKGNLGDKEYVIVKNYKPVLGESMKITESPAGDTATVNPPVMEYNIRAKKAPAEYETGVIKAVKIKDEQLAKLYRTYLKLGMGNYTTYLGDLHVNALRLKSGAVGLALNHYSGDPGLDNAGSAGFSNNHAGIYGKYFLENAAFSGNIDYNRDVVHYYGYDTDTIISKDDIKQKFNNLGMLFSFGSSYLTRDHLDYKATFGYSTLNDLYDVSENDFLIAGSVGKKVDDYYLNGDVSFNYFHKSLAKNEKLSLNNDQSRSIISFTPTLNFTKEKINMVLGVNLSVEKNFDTDVHIFPKIDLSLPIAENILYVFAGVNGNVVKNSYRTITNENPFVTSEIQPVNTVDMLELKAGLNGNFSQRISFMASVKYITVENLVMYVNDSIYFNKFNIIYDNGNILNIHAEVGYKSPEKFNASLQFDQYAYSLDLEPKAWQRPNTTLALKGSYNLWDKFLINAAIFGSGKYYAKVMTDSVSFTAEKIKGYADINLGLEYRYTKNLSIFLNFNNLGFSRYYRWYNYPSERFNVLGGITFSF